MTEAFGFMTKKFISDSYRVPHKDCVLPSAQMTETVTNFSLVTAFPFKLNL